MCQKPPSPPSLLPPTPTEEVNVALRPHPISYQTPPPPLEGMNFALWPTSARKLPSKGPVIIYRLGGVGVFRGGSHGFLKTFRGDQP